MPPSRTGTAYIKNGVIVIAIRLDSGKRWVHRCPERPDDIPLDLDYARWLASELQRICDSGEWNPVIDGMPGYDSNWTEIDLGNRVRKRTRKSLLPKHQLPFPPPSPAPKKQLAFRLSDEHLEILDAEATRLDALVPGRSFTRSEALRSILAAYRPPAERRDRFDAISRALKPMTKEEAIQTAKEAGMLNADGSLAAKYRQEK